MKQLLRKIISLFIVGISVSSFCAMTRWDLMKQRLGFKRPRVVESPQDILSLRREAVQAFLPEDPASLVLGYVGETFADHGLKVSKAIQVKMPKGWVTLAILPGDDDAKFWSEYRYRTGLKGRPFAMIDGQKMYLSVANSHLWLPK